MDVSNQDTLEAIQLERERFDLDNWKARAPHELICAKICYIADEQQIFRRNIDTLISLRKTFSGEGKNEKLAIAVDAQLLKFVNALSLTNVTRYLVKELGE